MYQIDDNDSFDMFISENTEETVSDKDHYTPEEDEYEEIEENIEDFLDDKPISSDTDWDSELTDEIDYDQFDPDD